MISAIRFHIRECKQWSKHLIKWFDDLYLLRQRWFMREIEKKKNWKKRGKRKISKKINLHNIQNTNEESEWNGKNYRLLNNIHWIEFSRTYTNTSPRNAKFEMKNHNLLAEANADQCENIRLLSICFSYFFFVNHKLESHKNVQILTYYYDNYYVSYVLIAAHVKLIRLPGHLWILFNSFFFVFSFLLIFCLFWTAHNSWFDSQNIFFFFRIERQVVAAVNGREKKPLYKRKFIRNVISDNILMPH